MNGSEGSSGTMTEVAPEPLRFERREQDRWPLDGVATAFELGGAGFGHMYSLKMLDYSHGAMGANADEPLPPGAVVSVGFQTPGYAARRGHVVRCTPVGEGYRIAIAFEQRLAA